MTCILPKKEANMERLIFCESYFRIFWKRTIVMLKTVFTTKLALQKREINRCSILNLKALKYPTQSYKGGCMTI